MATDWPFPRTELAYNRASNNFFRFPFVVDGVSPASGVTDAEVQFYEPDGTEISGAIDLTYARPWLSGNVDTSADTDTWKKDVGFVGVVTATYDSKVEKARCLVDVVDYPFICMVSDQDLLRYKPWIASRVPSTQSDYSPQILAAFEEVQAAILAKGYRPALLFEPGSFRPVIIHRALALCCQGVWKKALDDRWQEDYEEHQNRADSFLDLALDGVRYDENEDGKLQASEEDVRKERQFLL